MPMLQAPVSAPYRNMGTQLWEQSINFKHRKWEFLITAKVLAANCLWMSDCVSLRACARVRVCVRVFNAQH